MQLMPAKARPEALADMVAAVCGALFEHGTLPEVGTELEQFLTSLGAVVPEGAAAVYRLACAQFLGGFDPFWQRPRLFTALVAVGLGGAQADELREQCGEREVETVAEVLREVETRESGSLALSVVRHQAAEWDEGPRRLAFRLIRVPWGAPPGMAVYALVGAPLASAGGRRGRRARAAAVSLVGCN